MQFSRFPTGTHFKDRILNEFAGNDAYTIQTPRPPITNIKSGVLEYSAERQNDEQLTSDGFEPEIAPRRGAPRGGDRSDVLVWLSDRD